MPPAPATVDTSSWRGTLGRLLDGLDPDPKSASVQAGSEPVPMALQFELRELIPRTMYRWNGPTSQAASASPAPASTGGSSIRLGVRPVRRSPRGTWVKGGMNWANLPHLGTRLDLDARHHAWFAQFAAMHRAAKVSEPGHDTEWLFLDESPSAVLWSMLAEAGRLGIELVGVNRRDSVELGREAACTLDASRTASGIDVAPRTTIDDEDAPEGTARPVGTHGIYAFQVGVPARIRLAPTARTLLPEQLRFLAAPRAELTLHVPVEEADEFLQQHLPALVAKLPVSSTDGSIAVPQSAQASLVLVAEFGPRHSLTLSWRWDSPPHTDAPAPLLRDVLPPGTIDDGWLPAADAPDGAVPVTVTLRDVDAAQFAAEVLPELTALPRVRVETRGAQPPYRKLGGAPHLTVTAVPTEKHDWFDLGITVRLDGKVIPFTKLFKALATGKPRLLLVDGSYLSLKHPAFAPLKELIDEASGLSEWEPNRLQITRRHTSLWSDFEDLADEAQPAIEWRALLREVRDDAPRAIALPTGLDAELRPYQQEGLSWLAFLWRNSLGGILADDMGLGKTVQTLALLQHALEQPRDAEPPRARRPFLVVAPTSVVSNWAAEAARFTPGMRVRSVSETQAKSGQLIADLAGEADLIVTSYALFRLDFEAYRGVADSTGWAGLILDEAQFVKNANALVSECARELIAPFKLAVTGTPMENSLTELHGLLSIVAPGLFPSPRRFGEEYVRTIEGRRQGVSDGVGAGMSEATSAEVRARRLARLRSRIRPFMLRRTKERVAPELPPKQEQTLHIELGAEHRELYDLYLQRERQKLFGLLHDLDKNRFIVFRSLTLLRLLALDPSLINAGHDGVPSAKLDALLEQLGDVAAEGHRALVFSQFTSYLRLVAKRLEAAGIAYVLLDGSTTKRADVIDRFKTGDAPVFLISLKAGGFGLNLTEADYVFLLDPWWNPASESQAIDRTHRIGQQRGVMVYRMIAAGTIEEKVMELGSRKAALFDAVVDDDELFSGQLTADDLRELLR